MFIVGLLSMFPALLMWGWKKSLVLGVMTWVFCVFQTIMWLGLNTGIQLNMVVFPELFVGFVVLWTWACFMRKPKSYQAGQPTPYVKAPTNPNGPVFFPACNGYQSQTYFGPQTQADINAWSLANPAMRIKK